MDSKGLFTQSELTVINVWNASCTSCAKEMGMLKSLSHQLYPAAEFRGIQPVIPSSGSLCRRSSGRLYRRLRVLITAGSCSETMDTLLTQESDAVSSRAAPPSSFISILSVILQMSQTSSSSPARRNQPSLHNLFRLPQSPLPFLPRTSYAALGRLRHTLVRPRQECQTVWPA